MKPKIVCNMCEKTFEGDSELKYFGIYELPAIVKDVEDSFHGCPECETDEYLMDMEDKK